MTHDTAFEDWARKVWNFNASDDGKDGQASSLADFRKEVIIDVFNEAGQKVISYMVHRCWVSEYQALPDLDANANAIAIQTIKLENEGWERDSEYQVPDSRASIDSIGSCSCLPHPNFWQSGNGASIVPYSGRTIVAGCGFRSILG